MAAERVAPPTDALVEVRHLSKHYSLGGSAFGWSGKGPSLRAVDDVSLNIARGEVLGLVGESGSGKSTLGRLILRLLAPTAGRVLFDGEDLFALSQTRLRALRRRMQVIFQDPYASLNPRMTIAETIGDGLRQAGVTARGAQRERAAELLGAVGLSPRYLDRYPHMFSGGQRQRVAVARALSVQPELIVADEPVSALDVSVQAQVLNLLADVREQYGLTYLFISHDLNVIRYLADRVAVMHLGKLVELAPAATLFDEPLHPYTRALMDAAPRMEPPPEAAAGPDQATAPAAARLPASDGQPPVTEVPLATDRPFTADPILEAELPQAVELQSVSAERPTQGCRYRPRCPLAQPICADQAPAWLEVRPHHLVACHVVQAELAATR